MKNIKDNNISVFEEVEEIKQKPVYKYIGIAFSTYIIIEINNEMYIIFEKLIKYSKIREIYSKMGSKWGIDDFVA